jgi:hypothetical protein
MKPAGRHTLAAAPDALPLASPALPFAAPALPLALPGLLAARDGLAGARHGPPRAVPAPVLPPDAVAAENHAPAVPPHAPAAGADGFPSETHAFGGKTNACPLGIHGPGAAIHASGTGFTKSPPTTTVSRFRLTHPAASHRLLSAARSHAIEGRILILRGEKVLLDRDLAELYEVETKALICRTEGDESSRWRLPNTVSRCFRASFAVSGRSTLTAPSCAPSVRREVSAVPERPRRQIGFLPAPKTGHPVRAEQGRGAPPASAFEAAGRTRTAAAGR